MHYLKVQQILIICLITSTSTQIVKNSKRTNKSITSFPDDFKFGVSTSAHQIEGAWNDDGKGVSIWDTYSHSGNHIEDNSTADVACDSYHKIDEDIRMLKQHNVSFYRFSLSWTRLFPYGTISPVNKRGVEYYDKLINALRNAGIEPMVTLFHWDTPQNLQDLGGWANDEIVNWFVDYADKAFDFFGDRVKQWITMNEPANYCHYGYSGPLAPNLNNTGIGEYICAHNIILAHAKAYRLYQSKYKKKQNGIVGITLDSSWKEPEDPNSLDDKNAAMVAMEAQFGWFAYPIFKTGDYPKSMRQRIDQRSFQQGYSRSRLPYFSKKDRTEIFGSYDFLGLNHYETNIVKFAHQPASKIPNKMNDIDVKEYYNSSWKQTAHPFMHVKPDSLKKLLLWIGDNFGKHLAIVITENGYAGWNNDTCVDKDRIDYLNSYLTKVLEAINDGANVVGYTYWSLMDNFEWTKGYEIKFGLYNVDFNDPGRPRTPKKSALVFSNIIKTRKIDTSYDPVSSAFYCFFASSSSSSVSRSLLLEYWLLLFLLNFCYYCTLPRSFPSFY